MFFSLDNVFPDAVSLWDQERNLTWTATTSSWCAGKKHRGAVCYVRKLLLKPDESAVLPKDLVLRDAWSVCWEEWSPWKQGSSATPFIRTGLGTWKKLIEATMQGNNLQALQWLCTVRFHVCLLVYAHVHAHMCACVWRSEVNVGCPSLVLLYLWDSLSLNLGFAGWERRAD